MKDEEIALVQKIEEYVYQRYASYICKDYIVYGKASFSVDMLIKGSRDTFKLNPNKSVYDVIDYMFDYFCS